MPKDLLAFLFAESFQPSEDEMIAELMEHAKEVEDLQVKKQPLEKALKGFGFEGKVEVDENGAFAKFEDDCAYSTLVGKLKTAEGIVALAELGWVPAFGGDTKTEADAPCFKLYFIEMDEIEPADAEKAPDLEKLVKDLEDEEGPEGIGADLEAPKGGDKGGKVPPAPKVKSAIKD